MTALDAAIAAATVTVYSAVALMWVLLAAAAVVGARMLTRGSHGRHRAPAGGRHRRVGGAR